MSETRDPLIQRVAICALTYRRPEGLARLLAGLDPLRVPDGVEVGVFIVDNDPGSSARSIVEAHRSVHELQYVSEPRPGISHARNTAVASGLAWGADAVCFIDDDERPEPDWLAEFIVSQAETDADIVTGTVIPDFEEPPPEWIVRGGFFDRRRHEHHEPMRYATTSTVLITKQCFDGRVEPFDPAFGLSGGEDTHLFAQLRESGHSIVWCDHARVHETIPASRVNVRWLLAREYRRGQTLSLSLRRRDPEVVTIVRRVGNGSLHIGRGLVATLLGLRNGRAGVVQGVKQVVFGGGMLTGLLGRRYQEYATTHGT